MFIKIFNLLACFTQPIFNQVVWKALILLLLNTYNTEFLQMIHWLLTQCTWTCCKTLFPKLISNWYPRASYYKIKLRVIDIEKWTLTDMRKPVWLGLDYHIYVCCVRNLKMCFSYIVSFIIFYITLTYLHASKLDPSSVIILYHWFILQEKLMFKLPN